MHVIAHMRAPTECARTQRKNRTAFLPLTQAEAAGAAAAVPQVFDTVFCREFAGCTGSFLLATDIPRSALLLAVCLIIAGIKERRYKRRLVSDYVLAAGVPGRGRIVKAVASSLTICGVDNQRLPHVREVSVVVQLTRHRTRRFNRRRSPTGITDSRSSSLPER